MDKHALRQKILQLEGLTHEEKSALLELLQKQKKYGLVWEEKPEEVEERLRDSLPILREVKERAILSDSPDAPNHILIEGDNLEALTALSYTHEGKIDVIYIDPPYNTGNKDFVYNDSYVDSEDSFRHSKWLSFMSKRLKVAKRLLSDKGVIFISIDDNEQAQLKLLCDEIFIQSNYVATLPTVMNLKGNQDEFGFAGTHEYTLVYAKNYSACSFGVLPVDEEELDDWMQDEKGYYKQGANLKSTGVNAPKEKRPNLYYPILINKFTKEVCSITDEEYSLIYDSTIKEHDYAYLDFLESKYVGQGYYWLMPITNGQGMSWRWSRKKILAEKDDVIVSLNGETISLYKKQRPQIGDVPSKKPKTLFYKPEYSSGNGKAEIISVLSENKFGYPKPIELIKDILLIGNGITILDFFAGSGTTLHATMQLNADDGGHRQCILVTNNENNICEEVTYVRNKRVINGYTTPRGEKVKGLKNNSLRYYKTEMLPRTRSPRNMRALMAAATDLLCVKEDLYEECMNFGKLKTHPRALRFFEKNNRRMLVLYNEELTERIVEEIKTMDFGDKKLKIYIFSPDRYAFDDNFIEVQDKVQLVALPAAIYDAYQRVLPKQPDRLLTTPTTETADAPETTAQQEIVQTTLKFDE